MASKKKTIVILTTRHECTDNRVYQKEVLSLASFGYNVLYIAPNNLNRKVENVSFISIKNIQKLSRRLFLMPKLFRLIKKMNPDLVHIQDVELLPLLLKIKKKLKIACVYDVHEDYRLQMLDKFWLPSFSRLIISKYISHLEKKADKKLDGIVCADNFIANYFHNKRNIVAFNYPKLSDYNHNLLVANIEKRTKYDIIFPGSMKKSTFDLIVDIMIQCREKGRKIKCCLVSPFHFPGGKEYVYNRIAESRLEDSFSIFDPVMPVEVQHFLCSSKIGLIPLPDTPKLRHNIPTKMFEYMFEYLPFVGSNLPPARQYCDKCNCGYLVEANNVNDYVDKIIYLLDNPKEANRLGKNGHDYVISHLSWEFEALKIRNLYEEILNGN